MQKLMKEKEAATYLGYSIWSMQKSRNTGLLGGVEAPKSIKIGAKTIRYKKEDLDTWIEKNSEA